MKARGLLFDLDGVLVSTEKNHFEAWSVIADELGIDFGLEQNELIRGVSRFDSLRIICQLGGVVLNEDDYGRYMDIKNELYLASIESLNRINLFPGVINLLQKASEEGLKLGVGSSSKNAVLILKKLSIDTFFDVIVDGNAVQHPKPNPEVFLKGANEMGLDVSNVIVFEDAESGVLAAKSGGFHTIGVGNVAIKYIADEFIENLDKFNLAKYA
jgi:beta-phosphoglucomutase